MRLRHNLGVKCTFWSRLPFLVRTCIKKKTCRRFYLEKIKHGEEGGEEDGGIVNNDLDDDEGFIRNIDDNEEMSDEENQTIVQEQLHTNNYDECDDLEEPTAMHENEGSTERSSQNLNSFVNDCHINFPVSIPTT